MQAERRRFRYEEVGDWYKGNCHIHTTASDGSKGHEAVAALYAAADYDFLVRTDHWVASRVREEAAAPLLWIDGMELDGPLGVDGPTYHVLCLGHCPAVPRDAGLEEAVRQVRDAGAMTLLAHPHWCGNTTEDALRLPFDGVEVWNLAGQWLNGKADGSAWWEVLLARDTDAVGLATDDVHFRDCHPAWDGAWIVANAPALERDAILTAIRAGRFYASTGPAIEGLRLDGSTLHVRTSPVRMIRLVGPGPLGCRQGAPGALLLTEARFDVPTDWPWVRLELEDDAGRRAWTNTLFTAAEG